MVTHQITYIFSSVRNYLYSLHFKKWCPDHKVQNEEDEILFFRDAHIVVKINKEVTITKLKQVSRSWAGGGLAWQGARGQRPGPVVLFPDLWAVSVFTDVFHAFFPMLYFTVLKLPQ